MSRNTRATNMRVRCHAKRETFALLLSRTRLKQYQNKSKHTKESKRSDAPQRIRPGDRVQLDWLGCGDKGLGINIV
ncbi:hypothetical protein SUGI_0614580 [Cryptomeria japonica]|nr:hypothetical protein SUGI_0614580 [Cryptomeria japonica]